jgi:hypothetical protein
MKPVTGSSIVVPAAIYSNHHRVVRAALKRVLTSAGARSLLDVGAGTLSTALPLSRTVERYLAIEQDPSRAILLRQAGLIVVSGTFPISVKCTFDVVISSHALPPSLKSYPDFLDGLAASASNGGTVALITFDGCEDHFRSIRSTISGEIFRTSKRFDTIVSRLQRYGHISCQTIDGRVWTQDHRAMVEYLRQSLFRRTDHDALLVANISDFVTQRCRKGKRFILDTPHSLIICEKRSG